MVGPEASRQNHWLIKALVQHSSILKVTRIGRDFIVQSWRATTWRLVIYRPTDRFMSPTTFTNTCEMWNSDCIKIILVATIEYRFRWFSPMIVWNNFRFICFLDNCKIGQPSNSRYSRDLDGPVDPKAPRFTLKHTQKRWN